jgi:phospholipid transport system substrate-binding protein
MRLAALLSVLSVLFLAVPAIAQAADDTAQASAFVDNVAKQAFDTIKNKRAGKLTDAAARTNFRKILSEAFDVDTIARFTLGRYWRVATPAEQKEFTRLIQSVILDKYADRVLSYSGDGYKINESKAINDKDYGVAMTIDRKKDPSVDLNWRLRKSGKSFKVIDMSVEGISMSVTHRTDFASVIERNGGQVSSLIKALKNKETLPSDKK